MSKNITRRQLYERVWARPVVYVAQEMGLAKNALPRVCRRNRIPVPGLGFWNWAPGERKAYQTPLPEPEEDWEVTYTPSRACLPEGTAGPSTDGGIAVPGELLRPHRLIREASRMLRAARKDAYGRRVPPCGCLDIMVSDACLRRALRIMNVVLKECEARGWTVGFSVFGDTVVTSHGGTVPVKLKEMLRREPRGLTQDEIERDRLVRTWPRRYPLYARFSKGQLGLLLGWPSEAGRTSWKENHRVPIGRVLERFLGGLEQACIFKRQHDEDAARCEVDRKERERKAYERERARLAEEERVESLLADAQEWDKGGQLRAYIEAVHARAVAVATAEGRELSSHGDAEKWVAWARVQAERVFPAPAEPPALPWTMAPRMAPSQRRELEWRGIQQMFAGNGGYWGRRNW